RLFRLRDCRGAEWARAGGGFRKGGRGDSGGAAGDGRIRVRPGVFLSSVGEDFCGNAGGGEEPAQPSWKGVPTVAGGFGLRERKSSHRGRRGSTEVTEKRRKWRRRKNRARARRKLRKKSGERSRPLRKGRELWRGPIRSAWRQFWPDWMRLIPMLPAN